MSGISAGRLTQRTETVVRFCAVRDPAELLARRLAKDPHDAEAYDALRNLYRSKGDFASLTNLIEGWAQFQADPRLAGQGFVDAARSWRSGSGDVARTRDLLRKALERDPTHRDGTRELLALYAEQADTRGLADFLDGHLRRLEAGGGEPNAMAELYARLGDVWRVTFARPDVAGPCYQRALELDPLCATAAEGAHALAGPAPDPQQEARLLAARAQEESDPSRRAETLVRLASLVAPEAAIESLEAALQALPTHEPALSQLERVARELGRELLLAPHWVNYLARVDDGPDAERRRLWLAEAYARAGQLDDAIYCLEQSRETGPDSRAAELLRELKSRRDERAGAAAETALSPTDPHQRVDRVSALRREVHDAIVARNNDTAARSCRELIALEPGDSEAFAFLEGHYRKQRDYARLRGLLQASTQIAGLALEVQKQRLAEVASLCEAKLNDTQGAIEAFRDLLALDPTDPDARKGLKRSLTRTQRWDELASMLEREASGAEDPAEKIALLRQSVTIHRDKRKDLPETAEALRQLLALLSGEGLAAEGHIPGGRAELAAEGHIPGGRAELAAVRDELCDMLLAIDNHVEAVPLLRERVALASDERDKLRLLRTLAETLDERQGDPEGAYAVCRELLALRPKDEATLLRMERIDERTGNVARLLDTLEQRTALSLRGERPALLARMAELAENQLDDADRAAAYYTRALDLTPTDDSILGALCAMFERKQRFSDLAELLKGRIVAEKDPNRRIELERRRARVLKDFLLRDDEAAAAYQQILALRDDPEALQFLLEYARGRADAATVAELAASLARVVSDPAQKRALLLERARVLRDELDRPREAARALRELVEKLQPAGAQDDAAIDELSELCEQLGDAAGLAVALRSKHERAADAGERAVIAQRLSDLCEHELRDSEAAIAALSAWTRDEPQLAAPHRRLVKLLSGGERASELVASYDALSRLEEDEAARTRAALDAARLAWNALHDADGAFLRLGPLVEAGNDDAFEALADIAEQAERSEALAGLCVTAAQRARDPLLQGKNWRAAAHVYGQRLGNTKQALEAALRMLATDLSDRVYLSEVEDYAERERAWPRLAQVYERLLKSASDDAERVELLNRHADLLETRAQDPAEAFRHVLRACALAPDDEGLLVRAEELAKLSGRGADLLALYDARARVADPLERFELALRAARLCDAVLDDRDRASAYLKGALALAAADTKLWERVASAAEALDRQAQQRHGPGAALRRLVQAHRELAERAGPELGPQLIQRADGLLRERLRDDQASFDLLRIGVALFPLHPDVYEALAERAAALGRLDALDTHLAKCVDRALDPKTASTLLTRRVALLEGPLGRPQEAVDVLTKLLQLRPDDHHAAARLRRTLRKARRFQDLLLVIHKQMQRVQDAGERLSLLKETASIWESDLKNRFEARDAWRKALELAPHDPEALAGLDRVQRRLSSSQPLSEPPPSPDEPAEAAEAEQAAPNPPAAETSETEAVAAAASDDTHDLEVDLDLVAAEEEPQPPPKPPRLVTPARTHPPPPPPAALTSRPPPPRKSE